LRLLGLDAQDMEELPRCVDAAELARDMDRAMGSLYVLEGATLGGRVISRHLRRLSWRTARRLAFFNPYGAETGAMWMAFCVRAAALSRPTRDPQIVGAAVETFGTIHRWLQPAFARSEKDLLTT
jgi:heme oxygenase